MCDLGIRLGRGDGQGGLVGKGLRETDMLGSVPSDTHLDRADHADETVLDDQWERERRLHLGREARGGLPSWVLRVVVDDRGLPVLGGPADEAFAKREASGADGLLVVGGVDVEARDAVALPCLPDPLGVWLRRCGGHAASP